MQSVSQRKQRPSLHSEYTGSLGNALMRHRSDVAMNAAKVEAEIASRAKSQFIATMSHELRTPLNAILGFSEVLRMKGSKPDAAEKAEEYAGYIHDSAKQLLVIVNDLLELSKIQAEMLELEPAHTDLDDIIKNCLIEFEPSAAKAEISVECHTQANQFPLFADSARLQQAFNNILSNAVKFNQAGGKVVISSELAGLQAVTLKITDTGIGITPEQAQKALQPFGQADQGLTRKYEGTGLGLPIAKALIELHGGTLKIASHKQGGSEVTITLPLEHELSA